MDARLPSTERAAPGGPEDTRAIQRCLNQRLGAELVAFRQGQGNTRVAYIEGWRVLELANETFGYDGWSSSLQQLVVDSCTSQGGKHSVSVHAIVRVTLRGGSYHEDVGFGSATNMASEDVARDKALKEASTDAVKRALRMFGSSLGNCLYDKSFIASAGRGTVPPSPSKRQHEYRHEHDGGPERFKRRFEEPPPRVEQRSPERTVPTAGPAVSPGAKGGIVAVPYDDTSFIFADDVFTQNDPQGYP